VKPKVGRNPFWHFPDKSWEINLPLAQSSIEPHRSEENRQPSGYGTAAIADRIRNPNFFMSKKYRIRAETGSRKADHHRPETFQFWIETCSIRNRTPTHTTLPVRQIFPVQCPDCLKRTKPPLKSIDDQHTYAAVVNCMAMKYANASYPHANQFVRDAKSRNGRTNRGIFGASCGIGATKGGQFFEFITYILSKLYRARCKSAPARGAIPTGSFDFDTFRGKSNEPGVYHFN
jgi:hypothetical protein